jgi:hypothetical protein
MQEWHSCREQWLITIRTEFYKEMTTTNAVESFNNTVKTIMGPRVHLVRMEKVLQMFIVDVLQRQSCEYEDGVRKAMQKHAARKDDLDSFTLYATEQILLQKEVALQSQEVNMTVETMIGEVNNCSCMYFQLKLLPCHHFLSMWFSKGKTLDQLSEVKEFSLYHLDPKVIQGLKSRREAALRTQIWYHPALLGPDEDDVADEDNTDDDNGSQKECSVEGEPLKETEDADEESVISKDSEFHELRKLNDEFKCLYDQM